jgi:hypothetical protein
MMLHELRRLNKDYFHILNVRNLRIFNKQCLEAQRICLAKIRGDITWVESGSRMRSDGTEVRKKTGARLLSDSGSIWVNHQALGKVTPR